MSRFNDFSDIIILFVFYLPEFGEDYSLFVKDSVYKNATVLCVLQIG